MVGLESADDNAMTTTTWKINPEALRRRSLGVPDCNEIPTAAKNVVSFLIGQQQEEEEEEANTNDAGTNTSTTVVSQLARVTVYCDTGTVAVGRILLGKVRHVFRRNISSLDVVERLLRKPPNLTNINPNVMNCDDVDNDSKIVEKEDEKKASSNEKEQVRFAKIVKTNIELSHVGIAILQGERERLVQHVKNIEPPPLPATTTQDESTVSAECTEFQFSLPEDHMKHVDQCLEDIEKMGRLVKSVTTNGKGTVFLYGNGGVAYTPGIPRALYNKLSQFQKTGGVRPAYVVLGTRERFFVSFSDDTFAFKGPKGLERELKQSRKRPQSVAFGGHYDTFFIVYEDGSWFFNGKTVPKDLEQKLTARLDRPDLMCVNLGPSGEWFLRARNGRIWWGGISEEMDETIQDLLDEGHYLNFLDFGEEGSYCICYE